jgi:transposase
LPPVYGPYTTVYNRFNRWSKRGIWQRIFTTLAGLQDPPILSMVDSTAVRAHRSASGARGGERHQAIGRSRGGRTTKIHALVNDQMRPYAFLLTGGHVADIKGAATLLSSTAPSQHLIADKAYDANHLRGFLQNRQTTPVIPNKANRKTLFPFDAALYRARNLVERCFCRLKDFRAIATRYDKTAGNFLAGLCLAAALTFWI